MSRQRLYRLQPWLVRALIPPTLIGTYTLYTATQPVYVGRSDRDLRQRLLQHSAADRADYFTYALHPSSRQAFDAECGLFHCLGGTLTNVIHPDRPDYADISCAFCLSSLLDVRANRLRPRRSPSSRHSPTAETETPRLSQTQGAA